MYNSLEAERSQGCSRDAVPLVIRSKLFLDILNNCPSHEALKVDSKEDVYY